MLHKCKMFLYGYIHYISKTHNSFDQVSLLWTSMTATFTITHLCPALRLFPRSALSDQTFKTHIQKSRPGPNRWFCGNNGLCFVHLTINSLRPQYHREKVPQWQSKGVDTAQRELLSHFGGFLFQSVLCLGFMRLSGGSTVREWWIMWGGKSKERATASLLLSTVYKSLLLFFPTSTSNPTSSPQGLPVIPDNFPEKKKNI